jgi:FixJ family two-component response regulator
MGFGGGPVTVAAPVVFLVDDDQSALKALTRLLKVEGFETRPFSSSASFLEGHDPDVPGCIVLDVAMPEMNGLELQKVLTSARRAQPVVFISGASDIPTSVSAMKGGAVDFLTKPVTHKGLIRAVEQAIRRNQELRQSETELETIKDRLSKLTPREKAVFTQVVTGRLNKQIAANLGIVEKTVKVHRGRMMRKMGVRTLAELVQLADRGGVTTKPSLAT